MNLRIERSFLVMLAGLGIVIVPLAAQEKIEKAGDAGVQACVSCHETSHLRIFDMWKTSGHSKSLSLIVNNSQASADCYGCHSDEGFKAKLQGKKIDTAQKESFNSVTCVTCHNPEHGKNLKIWRWVLKICAVPAIPKEPCSREKAVKASTRREVSIQGWTASPAI